MLSIHHFSFQSYAQSYQTQIMGNGEWSFLHVVHMAEADYFDFNETYKQIMTDSKSSQLFSHFINILIPNTNCHWL